MAKMESARIKKEILAVLMESPLYFTIPLRKRLEFLKLFSQQSIPHSIFEYKELRISGKSDFKWATFDPSKSLDNIYYLRLGVPFILWTNKSNLLNINLPVQEDTVKAILIQDK